MPVCVLFVLLSFVSVGLLQGTGSGTNGNLRLCVVEGRGSFKRAPKFCPILDRENSGVECVLGTDRLDCLRRISKGTVDFGVFSPEDLVAAQWANIDVLVTNEIRYRNSRPFERNVVAVVNRRILPDSPTSIHAVLYNTTLCHPGVGADDLRPLSDTLSGYLETLVLEKSCDPELSLAENRIKALAGFFGRACKAGPWVEEKARDMALKRKYPSLCAACGAPAKCLVSDRYWGDTGVLTCLDEGVGDVTWAEYDDIATYFQLESAGGASRAAHFALLCRDGSWMALDAPAPCVWLHRPWNVLVAKRKAALAVTKLAETLTNSSTNTGKRWPDALASLLQSTTALRAPLSPPPPPADYLARAKGFREAYSQAGCDPPRHITLCTTTPLARNKCEWMSEAGAVYGIAPAIQCVLGADTAACMGSVREGAADVTPGDRDWLVRGRRDYNVTPILHEVTPIVEKTNTVFAFVKNSSQITNMEDLRGKRAAFPNYDGVTWHSTIRYLEEKQKVSCKEFVSYFSEICAPGVEGKFENAKNCYEDGEIGALKSLLDGKSDVAFVSMMTYKYFVENEAEYAEQLKEITPLCPPDNTKYCFLSWSSLGHIFASNNLTAMRRQEIINVMENLDKMFGKHPPFHIPMFAMYGSFNHKLNVLFHNNTRTLATDAIFKTHPYESLPLNFESKIANTTDFSCSFGAKLTPSLILLVLSLLAVNS